MQRRPVYKVRLPSYRKGKKTNRRGKGEREKNITTLTHLLLLNHQPHSHLDPLHPLQSKSPAKTRTKLREEMHTKSRNAQEVY